MSSTNEFQSLLWRELEASNLVPDIVTYKTVRSEISQWGAFELERVRSLVGSDVWRNMLSGLKRSYPEKDCIRVLGFGHALTEFTIAPLSLPDPVREEVISLGALANFIVTTYDHFVDLGINQKMVLPRWALQLAAQDRGRLRLAVLGFAAPPAVRLTVRLVNDYFRRLRQLPCSKDHVHVYEYIKWAILRMYDAEGETLKLNKTPLDEHTLRIKSAFPFMVMALPAWLGIPELCRDRYWWHIQWLYRFGEFFGWIDDSIDLNEDIASGRSNRIVNARTKWGSDNQDDVKLARMIANRGKHVFTEWYRQIEHVNDLPLITREAFATCLVSWFGGLPRY